MKSPEFVPRSEDQKEEDERLYKNDPGMHVKTGGAGKFESIDKIVDSDTEEGNKDDETEEKEIPGGFPTKEEIGEKEKEEERLKSEIIGIVEGEEGTVHAGPEVRSEEILKDEYLPQSSHVIVSPIREKINALLHGWNNRRELKDSKPHKKTISGKTKYVRGTEFGVGKDNMKTMPAKKIERMSREKIKEFLDGQSMS